MSLTANSTGKLLGTAAITYGSGSGVSNRELQGSATITYGGAPTSNTALSLPGTSGNYMNLGATHPAHFDTRSSSLFMEAWVYSLAANGSVNQQIVAVTDNSSTTDWNLFIGTDNIVHFGYWAPTYTQVVTGTISFAAWNHVALSWNPTTRAMYVFLNGVASGPITAGTTGVYSAARELHIGSETTGSVFNGYIRDVRILQGGSVPTSTLTPIASAPFGPGTPTYVASMGTKVLSLYTDYFYPSFLTLPGSSGNYMNLGSSSPANFDCTTSNLFCEMWVYRNTTGQQFIINNMNVSNTNKTYAFYFRPDSKLELDTQTRSAISTNIVSTGVWTHIAFSIVVPITSNGTRIFINGNLEATSGNATSETYDATRTVYIGYFTSDSRTMNGYIQDLRVVQGGIVPTTSFTPGAAPFGLTSPSYAPGGATVLSLATQYMQKMVATPATASPLVLTGTAAIAHGSGSGVSNRELQGSATITYGGAPTSNTAVSFPGTSGSYLNLGSTHPGHFDPTSSNVFVECWVYFNSLTSPNTTQMLCTTSSGVGSEDMGLWVYTPTQSIVFRMWNTSGQQYGAQVSGALPSAGVWYHMAGSWDYTTKKVYAFRNGVLGDTINTLVGTVRYTAGASLQFGASELGTFYPFNGYMRDFRIVRGGTVPTTTFTPASVPFGPGTPTYVASMGTKVLSLYTDYFYPSWLSLPGPAANCMNLGAPPRAYFAPTFNTFIQTWVYLNSTSGEPYIIISTNTSAVAYTEDWALRLSGGYFQFYINNSIAATAVAQSTATVVANRWYHVAASYVYNVGANGTLYLFVNGVLQGSGTAMSTGGPRFTPTNIIAVGSLLSIFGWTSINGYIQDLQIVSEGSVPTTTFTPGAAPFGLMGPSYASTGTTVLSLATQYMQKTLSSGQPLFSQLSTAATSSAVGAYSLRSVNGSTVKVAKVNAKYPTGTFSAYTSIYGVVSASSEYPPGGDNPYAWKAFDGLTASPNYWASGANYTQGIARTTGTVTVAGGTNYYGDWLQIQLPVSFVPTGYALVAQQAIVNTPGTWYVFGSTDGSTWTLLDTRSGIASATFTNFVYNTYTITGATTSYNYYRIVCNIVSVNTSFALAEFAILRTSDFWADRRGNLLTAPVTGQPLGDWLQGVTGLVDTWYDQTGAGNHATQTNLAIQPLIQRATKGPGFMLVFNNAQYLIGFTYSVLNNTNYTVCKVDRRTASVSSGGNGVDNAVLSCGNTLNTNQNMHVTYRSGTSVYYGQYSNDISATITNFATAATEPIRYNLNMASSTSGRRIYVYNDPLGPILANGPTQTALLAAVGGNFYIGYYSNNPTYYTGELYEVLVFRSSLYDLDNTDGQITAIYQNQLSYTGT